MQPKFMFNLRIFCYHMNLLLYKEKDQSDVAKLFKNLCVRSLLRDGNLIKELEYIFHE